MKENQLYHLSSSDPLFQTKNTSIQSFNQTTSLIKENKGEMYSKVYYAFSLLFAVFIAIFSESLGLLFLLVILDIFLIFLIYEAKKFYKRRIDLAEKKRGIENNLTELGIKIEK